MWDSQFVNVTIDGYLNIPEMQNDVLNIYPNPFSHSVTINVSSSEGKLKEILLMNMLGKVIIHDESALEKIELDVSNLESGTYLLRVRHAENYYTEKIIKL